MKIQVNLIADKSVDYTTFPFEEKIKYGVVTAGRYIYDSEVVLDTIELDIDFPEITNAKFVEKEIATLQQAKENILQKADEEVQAIDERLNQLIALEYKP